MRGKIEAVFENEKRPLLCNVSTGKQFKSHAIILSSCVTDYNSRDEALLLHSHYFPYTPSYQVRQHNLMRSQKKKRKKRGEPKIVILLLSIINNNTSYQLSQRYSLDIMLKIVAVRDGAKLLCIKIRYTAVRMQLWSSRIGCRQIAHVPHFHCTVESGSIKLVMTDMLIRFNDQDMFEVML